MLHVDRIADLRAACDDARASGKRVGVVPTMGFLHDGHRSLMRAARAAAGFVVVTIFVNPLQFGVNEDLDRYPRDLDRDLDLCEASGVDCVFTPSVAEMYPRSPLTSVHVGRADRRPVRRQPARPTSTGSRPWSRSCSRSSVRAPRSSVAKTPSSSRSSRGWPTISTSRSMSWAARSCARSTASRCRVATRTFPRPEARSAQPVLVLTQSAAQGGRRDRRRRA